MIFFQVKHLISYLLLSIFSKKFLWVDIKNVKLWFNSFYKILNFSSGKTG